MELGEGDSIAAIARISREEVELSEQTNAASVAAGEAAPRRSRRKAAAEDVEVELESEMEIVEEENDYPDDEDQEGNTSAD